MTGLFRHGRVSPSPREKLLLGDHVILGIADMAELILEAQREDVGVDVRVAKEQADTGR